MFVFLWTLHQWLDSSLSSLCIAWLFLNGLKGFFDKPGLTFEYARPLSAEGRIWQRKYWPYILVCIRRVVVKGTCELFSHVRILRPQGAQLTLFLVSLKIESCILSNFACIISASSGDTIYFCCSSCIMSDIVCCLAFVRLNCCCYDLILRFNLFCSSGLLYPGCQRFTYVSFALFPLVFILREAKRTSGGTRYKSHFLWYKISIKHMIG